MKTVSDNVFSKIKNLLKKLPLLLPSKGLYCRFLKELLLIKAWRSDKVFYCNALAGQSEYNICINSDLTVSCNCQDFDGDGHIGDLNKQTFKQIFHGATAVKFRTMLSDRELPTSFCPICPELSMVPRKKAHYYDLKYRIPYKGIMVENTVLCNLKCKMCNRQMIAAMRHDKLNLSLQEVQRISSILKKHEIESIYFFNLGEPFLPGNIREQLTLIRKDNPDIRIITSTNGMLLNCDEKLEAALLMDHVFISLDGVDQETVNNYQVGSDFQQTYENMTRLSRLKNRKGREQDGVRLPIVVWKYVVFRWNDKQVHIEKAIELAKAANVDLISFYLGGAPLHKKSFRYSYSSYFKKLGTVTEDGIIINLKEIPSHFLSPSYENQH